MRNIAFFASASWHQFFRPISHAVFVQQRGHDLLRVDRSDGYALEIGASRPMLVAVIVRLSGVVMGATNSSGKERIKCVCS
jgi:hypothetical protein